jgi:hypothetical protein
MDLSRAGTLSTLVPVGVKVLFTAASLVMAIAVVFAVTPAHKDEGRGWARGRRNLIWRAFYTPDGTFRKQAKPAIVAWFVLFNALMWVFF